MALAMTADSVMGHYMQAGQSWQALLAESSPLFGHVVTDQLGPVEELLEQQEPAKVEQLHLILYWGAADQPPKSPPLPEAQQPGAEGGPKTSVNVKQRSLLQLACFHGSLRVLAYLLSKGAEPSKKSPEGLTAFDFAASSDSPNCATMLAMLKDADHGSTCKADQFGALENRMSSQDLDGDPFSSGSPLFNTSELTRPEYSTDNFRMFCFKVLRCSKRHAHDWRCCPFAHPTENARRRDPREFKYCAVACPDYKQGFCIRGDLCPYSHGVFECWLHPSRYRTQLCKDGMSCQRPVCFFAHSLPELRTPTHTWLPTQEDVNRIGAQSAAAGGAAGGGANGMAPAAAPVAVNVAPAQAVQPQVLASMGSSDGSAGNLGMMLGEAAAIGMHNLGGSNGHLSGYVGLRDSANGSSGTPGDMSPRTAMTRHLSDGVASSCSGGGMMLGDAGAMAGIQRSASANCGGNCGSASVCSGAISGSSNGSSNGVSHANTQSGLPSPISGSASPFAPAGSGSLSHSSSSQFSAPMPPLPHHPHHGHHHSGGIRDAPSVVMTVNASSHGKGSAAVHAALHNLTQVSTSSSLLGFTAPRMSNAFARRHGLNPKDNPMLNLQKIALQSTDGAVGRRLQQIMTPAAMTGGMQQPLAPSPAGPPAGVHVPMQRQVRHMLPSSTFPAQGGNGMAGFPPHMQHQQPHMGYGPATYPAVIVGGAVAAAGGHPQPQAGHSHHQGSGPGSTDPNVLAAQLANLSMQQQAGMQHQHQAQARTQNGLAMGYGMMPPQFGAPIHASGGFGARMGPHMGSVYDAPLNMNVALHASALATTQTEV